MATIMFNPLVDDARRKVGRIVLSKWKHTNYARKYTMPGGVPSAKQLEIRSAFSILVEIWKSFNGVLHASWDKYAKNLDLNMTGFNSFVGKNSARLRNAEPLELFKESGEMPLDSLAAAAGASGSIVCAFTKPANSASKHVIFFSQKLINGKETAEIKRHEAGANPASPFTITGLEPGEAYLVYAVVTDNAYADAKTVSAALSAAATAGA